MLAKLHKVEGRAIVAICDDELLGKTFEEGELILYLPESFYGGEEVKNEQAIELIKAANSVHAVGEKTIALLLKADLVKEEQVKKIAGIPFIQIVNL